MDQNHIRVLSFSDHDCTYLKSAEIRTMAGPVPQKDYE